MNVYERYYISVIELVTVSKEAKLGWTMTSKQTWDCKVNIHHHTKYLKSKEVGVWVPLQLHFLL